MDRVFLSGSVVGTILRVVIWATGMILIAQGRVFVGGFVWLKADGYIGWIEVSIGVVGGIVLSVIGACAIRFVDRRLRAI